MGGYNVGRRTKLVPILQTMASNTYVQNIIHRIVYPLRNEIGHNFIFMDNNARPHRARRVEEVLEEGHIRRLNCPANSPDMNPIEHMWNYVKRAISTRNNPPITLQELTRAA